MSGLFGVISKDSCVSDLFYGTDYHSHLGTEYGGIAVYDKGLSRHIHKIAQTQFKSKFYEDYQHIKGNKGIGVISALNEQPMYLNSRFGHFCLATSGLVENSQDLASDLLDIGVSFTEVSSNGVNETELVAKLINQGKDIVDGIENMFKKISGSCSLLLLNQDGIYAARDRLGYTSLVIGQSEKGWAVTAETCAFPNSGYKIVKYLEPGEIVLLSEKGIEQKRPGKAVQQMCAFYWIYTGFPSSSYGGVNAETVREECGRQLARHDKDIKADLVAGVPDSGIAHAIGYAMQSKVPYRRPLVKYTPGYGRSYTPPLQQTRDLVAKMKIIPIEDIIKGNNIVVCDDSIVRGTQLKNFTVKKLWDCGARQIHARIACPPLIFPCRFNVSTRTIHELAARKAIKALEHKDIEDVSEYIDYKSDKYAKMVDYIAKDLKVTTLRYQTVDDMVAAIGLPKEKICLYCWTGRCPSNQGRCGESCSCTAAV